MTDASRTRKCLRWPGCSSCGHHMLHRIDALALRRIDSSNLNPRPRMFSTGSGRPFFTIFWRRPAQQPGESGQRPADVISPDLVEDFIGGEDAGGGLKRVFQGVVDGEAKSNAFHVANTGDMPGGSQNTATSLLPPQFDRPTADIRVDLSGSLTPEDLSRGKMCGNSSRPPVMKTAEADVSF
jgi:hypothetical protein